MPWLAGGFVLGPEQEKARSEGREMLNLPHPRGELSPQVHCSNSIGKGVLKYTSYFSVHWGEDVVSQVFI